jgi:hypothetical protein
MQPSNNLERKKGRLKFKKKKTNFLKKLKKKKKKKKKNFTLGYVWDCV